MGLSQWLRSHKLVVILCVCAIILVITTVAIVKTRSSSAKDEDGPKVSELVNSSIQSWDINYRLPRNVKPENYNLKLEPNLSEKTFHGTVSIALDVLLNTKEIILHSKYLNVSEVSLKDINSTRLLNISHGFYNDTRDFMFVKSSTIIKQGDSLTLEIKFAGRLDRGLVGFYSSTLKKGGTMVASKFQPTYARQAFPCFDEPEYKATFDITLVKPTTHIALSNMNEVSKKLDEKTNLETVTFAKSVPMVTYLACFVVCDFGFKRTEVDAKGIGKNFILQTYAQKDQMHKIDFALDIGKRATEFYIQYYEVPFPLPKLDMIAIPDYQSGATEHWGLITYRETSFLVDPETTAAKNKWNVANTIAHELAHMWFGNLVTLKWWNDLWLNEGFATYMQNKALNAIEPTWTMMELFLTRTLHPVLVTDAKLSSHPIVQTVDTPDQITAIFDAISYNKGASILRMLEGFIGEENFRKGISEYLKKYQFGSTVTQYLYNILNTYFKIDNPKLNLTHIMDTWTRQMGYPVVQVEKGAKPNTYVITQSRFLIDPTAKVPNDSPFSYRWFIPITYKTNKGNKGKMLWFADTSESEIVTLSEEETWLKLNNDQVGCYRVNYALDMWGTLIQHLKEKSPQLSISDRSHLLNDVFALADSGRVPYDLALNLTTYLTVEEDYVPWETAFTIFSVLEDRLMGSDGYRDLQKYVHKLITPMYEKQSWEKVSNRGIIESLLRSRILGMASLFKLPDAERKSRELLQDWLRKQGTAEATTVEPDLKDVVYYYGMQSASEADWDKLWQVYMREEDAQEQSKLRHALAAPNNTDILKKYLTLAWDEKNIRGQDYFTVLSFISANPSGTELVWDYWRQNWQKLVERFSLNNRYLGNTLPAITVQFSNETKLKEMESFFAQYPEAGAGESARKRALETVRNNIRWAKTHQASVAKWLRDNSS